jgi:hypothetical protein
MTAVAFGEGLARLRAARTNLLAAAAGQLDQVLAIDSAARLLAVAEEWFMTGPDHPGGRSTDDKDQGQIVAA